MEQIISDLVLAQTRAMTEGNWVEPVNMLLADVSFEEAFWKPVVDERSIAEIVVHTQTWESWAAGFLEGTDVDVEEWPDTGEASADNWESIRTSLASSYSRFRTATERLSVSDLEVRPVPKVTQMTRMQAILSITMHAAYHAGQIVKLRER